MPPDNKPSTLKTKFEDAGSLGKLRANELENINRGAIRQATEIGARIDPAILPEVPKPEAEDLEASQETQPTEIDDRPGIGQRAVETGRDFTTRQLTKQASSAIKAKAGQAAKAALTKVARTIALRNPWVLGAIAIIVGVIVIIAVLGLVAIGLSQASAPASGTSSTQPISSADRSSLEKTLDGRTTISETGAIGDPGSCVGIDICLEVEGVGEGASGHCGRASVLMALLYVNARGGSVGSNFKESNYIVEKPNGKQINNPRAPTCVADTTMNNFSPTGRKGWVRRNYVNASKEAIIDWTIRSLIGDDPVVLFLLPGAIFSNSPHIVTVVGYDKSDDSFLINNPNVGKVTLKTKYGDSRDKKLTSEHLKRYLGGDGQYDYRTSIIVRDVYTK